MPCLPSLALESFHDVAYRPIEPIAALVNPRMTQAELIEQKVFLPAQLQQVGYSIPDHFALPGVVLLVMLLVYNGRNLLRSFHHSLRNQYLSYQVLLRSQQVERLERIFKQPSRE